jgi:hypothetical protein
MSHFVGQPVLPLSLAVESYPRAPHKGTTPRELWSHTHALRMRGRIHEKSASCFVSQNGSIFPWLYRLQGLWPRSPSQSGVLPGSGLVKPGPHLLVKGQQTDVRVCRVLDVHLPPGLPPERNDDLLPLQKRKVLRRASLRLHEIRHRTTDS